MAGQDDSPPVLPTNQETSLFLTLPPELRNMIYHLVVHQDDEIVISATGKPSRRPPALAQVSQSIRAEALAIYFQNTFHATVDEERTGIPVLWLGRISRGHLGAMKSFILSFRPSGTYPRASVSRPQTFEPAAKMLLAVATLLVSVGVPASSIVVNRSDDPVSTRSGAYAWLVVRRVRARIRWPVGETDLERLLGVRIEVSDLP